ncbi:MAG: hypothetical protein CMJ18_02275 [Phycisphaeraceae bacterium]|nr:hypothetical protein [Phycisphaeraceae bacterium]
MDLFQLPSARIRAGVSREDITPPADIFSRCWGASLHDQASSIHHPFTVTALALQPIDDGDARVILALDLSWFEEAENRKFLAQVRDGARLRPDQLIVNLSHSHAAPNLSHSLADRPGGDRIAPYFEGVVAASIRTVCTALSDMQQAWITADYGRCSLAVNRNYPDESLGEPVCGFNPHVTTDDTLAYARVAADDGRTIASILNYGCHPTSLGPANRSLSPDYIAAARAIVEDTFGGHCLFLISPCGDTAPREGYAADPEVADRNGRQLGHAAASTATSLLPPGEQLVYTGPLISGATLATWARRPMGVTDDTTLVRSELLEIELPLRAKVGVAALEAERDERLAQLEAAKRSGDESAIRNATALVERSRRAVLREPDLPVGDSLTLPVWVWQFGRIVVIALPAEPFSDLQVALRRRFPSLCVIVGMNSNGAHGYVMPECDYGRGLYQEDISPAGRGSLEGIEQSVTTVLERWAY